MIAMSDIELMKGGLDLRSGQNLTIQMPEVHWKGLRWLAENHEGDVIAEIEELLRDPGRTNETNSQIVMWYVEIFLENIFEDDET